MPQVSDILVEQLGDWGVRHVFGVAGETVLGLLNAIRHQDRVRFIATQHEGSAAFAASAYGKLTGEPAACITMGGPGVTNLMTGIYDAQCDQVPLLAITGTVSRDRESLDERGKVDEMALFEPASVFNAQVEAASQAPTLLAGALHAAISQQGVAHLSVPQDVQTMAAEIAPIRPQGHLNWSKTVAAEESIRQAARLLEGSSRPLILAGAGAREAREPILQLAHRLNAPVLATCRIKGLFSHDEPLYMGVSGRFGTPLANSLLREADTILIVGSALSQGETGGWETIRPQQQLIQIDIDPARLGRTFALDAGLWGDAAATIRQLVTQLPPGPVNNEWGNLFERRIAFEGQIDAKATQQAIPIKPQFVVRTLQETLPPDAVIALDYGDHAFFVCQQYQTRGEKFVMSFHLGSTGFGLPAAIAGALAYPERQVVAVVGDAGLAASLGELITAVSYNLPIAIVCFNNSRMGMINSEQEMQGLPPFFTERPEVNFAQLAEASGVQALRVEDPQALAGALHQGIAAHRPFLLDITVDPMETQRTALEPLGAEAVI